MGEANGRRVAEPAVESKPGSFVLLFITARLARLGWPMVIQRGVVLGIRVILHGKRKGRSEKVCSYWKRTK